MKLGLDNVREFVGHIGNPQDSFPTIHVAGTNGKGSTVKMLGSILSQAGYKTGVFTSPHLVDFRERITIDGRKISREFVTKFIERHKPELVARKITYFEVMVSLALSYFDSRGVDIAVIETGLGGRLDATNVLAPIVCAITEISYDHTTILGDTLSKIAGEKGGIIKESTPVAFGVMPPSAERTLTAIAGRRSAPVLPLITARMLARHASFLGLAGEHQRENLRLALTVVSYLKRHGFRINTPAIQQGLQHVRWPGRFQRLKAPNGARIILDVAHNETGIDAFVRTFEERFPGRRAKVVAGFVKKKDHCHALQALCSIAESLALTAVKSRRSADPLELKGIVDSLPECEIPPVRAFKSSSSAFRYAYRRAERSDIIVIIGSHYLIGEYLRFRNSM